MTEWNNKKNMNITFKIEPNEDAKAFFERMMKDFVAREEMFKKRIKQLFDEEIEIEGEATKSYNKILQVFAIGYQHGWNDLHSLHMVKKD